MIGMLRVTQAFLPIMPRDWTGRIINISGIAGISGVHRRADARAQQLGDESGDVVPGQRSGRPRRSRSTPSCPGSIATEWRHGWAENMGKQQGKTKEQFLEDICKAWGIVSGRWGTMDELADLVTFLASDRAVLHQRRAHRVRRRLCDQSAITGGFRPSRKLRLKAL